MFDLKNLKTQEKNQYKRISTKEIIGEEKKTMDLKLKEIRKKYDIQMQNLKTEE